MIELIDDDAVVWVDESSLDGRIYSRAWRITSWWEGVVKDSLEPDGFVLGEAVKPWSGRLEWSLGHGHQIVGGVPQGKLSIADRIIFERLYKRWFELAGGTGKISRSEKIRRFKFGGKS